MRKARRPTRPARREHRPCHRCGWTADLVRVDRRGARRLGVSTAHRWLCEDCLGLHRPEVVETEGRPGGRDAEVERRIMA